MSDVSFEKSKIGSLVGIHRSIRRVHESVGDEDVQRMVERQVECGFDLSAEGIKARYAELLLGLDLPAKTVSGWQKWREVFAKRFVALDVLLSNFSVTPPEALIDDQASFYRLMKGVISRTTELGRFYHLQHENRFISSAMYYSNATLRVAESMETVRVHGGIHEVLARLAMRRRIGEMANPMMFLQSVGGFHPRKLELSRESEPLHLGMLTVDVQRAFVVQHLLEDLINDIWKRDENVVLQFGWNSQRGAIELKVPSNKVTADIVKISPRDLSVKFVADGSVIRVPIRLSPPSLQTVKPKT